MRIASSPVFQAIDWQHWQPKRTATAVYVREKERILLIRKRRGLGKGLITGVGGHIEPGESAEECAIREVQEELGIRVSHLQQMGRLRFQFTDGLALEVFVFQTTHFEGVPHTSEEAIPLWFQEDNIPYEEMWADDIHWLPQLLAGQQVDGRFLFEGETMIDGEVLQESAN